jgi:hypothetical protein
MTGEILGVNGVLIYLSLRGAIGDEAILRLSAFNDAPRGRRLPRRAKALLAMTDAIPISWKVCNDRCWEKAKDEVMMSE